MKLYFGSVKIFQEYYMGQRHRDSILSEWHKFIDKRQRVFHIQYFPILDTREAVNVYNKNKHKMKKVEKEQVTIVEENIFKMPVREIARIANVSKSMVYERMAKKKIIIKLGDAPEIKKELVRPPAKYSNPRLHDTP